MTFGLFEASGRAVAELRVPGVKPSGAPKRIDPTMRGALDSAELKQGLERALSHQGKPYDFLFDFRTADRMVCTEVIYRGFHGIGAVKFELKEVGGRLCLPAEKFLEQALACGY